MDDGFQHRKLERDKNILVVDASKKFSNGCLLPAGALRESVTEVQRADVIVVTNKSFDDRAAKTYARYLRKTGKMDLTFPLPGLMVLIFNFMVFCLISLF